MSRMKPLRTSRTGYHLVLVAPDFTWQAQTTEDITAERLAAELRIQADFIEGVLLKPAKAREPSEPADPPEPAEPESR